MRKLSLALTGAALLSLGCDPTAKHDFHCTKAFATLAACTQLHVTDAEGLAGQHVCENKGGDWGSGGCPADLAGAARVPGYCQVDASDYTLSGTDAQVYFYEPVIATVAEPACTAEGGTWHP